jgi:hypothetical protein
MKKQQNNSTRASVLQITLSVALILASAIVLISAAPTNPKEASGAGRLGVHSQGIVATPTLGNYPDTSLPLSTDTTVTPDAAPTNTTSINVSISTDFNGTLEGDPTTGVVRVTDAHPAGTYTVTVRAFDSGGATAIKTFTLTVTTAVTCPQLGFAPWEAYSTGGDPYSVAVGDFNGDGQQDLATANTSSDNVSILSGDGTGHFSAPANFAAGDGPESVAVGDFNGDGKQDLATANTFSDTVSILLGDGAGHFNAPANFAVGDFPRSVAVGDFDGDGKQDLAIANGASDNVSILLGDGAGHFSAPTNFAVGFYPYSVAVGDFNGDGKQDLAVANHNSDNVSNLLGDGTGHFSATTNFTAGDGPSSVAVGDFNGDGQQDLAVANEYSKSVSILLGDGAGHFSAPRDFNVHNSPQSVTVGDFNGDGQQDLAAPIQASKLSVLLGDGAGNFSAPREFSIDNIPKSVAVGDFNSDGQQDIAVTNELSSIVSILLRDCPATQITPVGTTCSQFASGSAETLVSMLYHPNHNLIGRVGPRGFLYWVKVTAPAGENIFRITQTITTGNFNTFVAGSGNGSHVFDSDCVSLQRTGSQSGNTVTVKFNAPAAGTYFIATEFNAQSLIGAPDPGTSVHYDFTTTGVPNSTSGLDLGRRGHRQLRRYLHRAGRE